MTQPNPHRIVPLKTSRSGLIERLEFESFTTNQVQDPIVTLFPPDT